MTRPTYKLRNKNSVQADAKLLALMAKDKKLHVTSCFAVAKLE